MSELVTKRMPDIKAVMLGNRWHWVQDVSFTRTGPCEQPLPDDIFSFLGRAEGTSWEENHRICGPMSSIQALMLEGDDE